MSDALLMIGEFSARSRLSAKALRLYDELGLLAPVRVDESTGYRWYAPEQLRRARLVALLRHLNMPLPRIADVLDLPGPAAAAAVRTYWLDIEQTMTARRAVVDYVCRLLQEDQPMRSYDVQVRSLPTRTLVSALRYVTLDEAGSVLGALLGRMRAAGPGLAGIAGCPFTIYHGAVSEDSDGPIEVSRPLAEPALATAAAARLGDVSARTEAGHDEAFVRLTMAEVAWPAQLEALDALERYVRGLGREAAGPPRHVMIADWRTAGPADAGCDLSVPLSSAASIPPYGDRRPVDSDSTVPPMRQ